MPAPTHKSRKASSHLEQLKAAVDELGAIEAELAPFAENIARAKQLRESIRSQFADSPAADPFEARGDRFTVLLGPKGIERTINPAKLIAAIGLKGYAAIAVPTLKSLEAGVPASVVAQVVTSARTGFRPLTILAKSE